MAHSIWNLSSATGWLQTFEKLNLNVLPFL